MILSTIKECIIASSIGTNYFKGKVRFINDLFPTPIVDINNILGFVSQIIMKLFLSIIFVQIIILLINGKKKKIKIRR